MQFQYIYFIYIYYIFITWIPLVFFLCQWSGDDLFGVCVQTAQVHKVLPSTEVSIHGQRSSFRFPEILSMPQILNLSWFSQVTSMHVQFICQPSVYALRISFYGSGASRSSPLNSCLVYCSSRTMTTILGQHIVGFPQSFKLSWLGLVGKDMGLSLAFTPNQLCHLQSLVCPEPKGNKQCCGFQ